MIELLKNIYMSVLFVFYRNNCTLNNRCRPFTHTGVDFAVYFDVYMYIFTVRNARNGKCYVALYICLSTNCVHLELVRDLSSAAFSESVRSFIARKRIPSQYIAITAPTSLEQKTNCQNCSKTHPLEFLTFEQMNSKQATCVS